MVLLRRTDRGGDLRTGVVVLRRRVLLQRLAGLGVQLLRHGHLDGDEQITVAAAALVDAAPPYPQRAPARRAGGHLQRHRAVEGRHAQGGAQRRLGVRDGHGQGQVVALASEQLVRADVHGDEQVTGRAAPRAGHALAGDAQPGTVADAGRYPDVDGAGLHGDPAALAVGAGVVDDLAGAAAVAARLAEPERPLVAADETGATAGRARVGSRARTRTAAVTGPAGSRPGQLQRQHRPVNGLVETECHLGVDVLALRRADVAPPGRRAPGEQPAEDLAEPTAPRAGAAAEDVGHVERRPAAGEAGSAAEVAASRAAAGEQCAGLVVLLALVLVGEDVVGLGHVLELGFGLGVARVLVRVQLAGQLAVRLLDVGGRGVLGDAQRLVVVLLDVVLRAHRRTSPPLSTVDLDSCVAL